MKKILNVVTSPLGANSFSTNLANALIEKLKAAYPGSVVTTRNLNLNPTPHLEEAHIASFYTPPDFHEDWNKEAIEHSDQAIGEIMDADIIVIGVPMYNFGLPSTLKAWIDHVVRTNKTFKITETGEYVGLVNGKKVYLCISTGGVYSDGPMKAYDFTEPYLRAILGFTGMVDITAYRVEGTAIPGVKETALANTVAKIEV